MQKLLINNFTLTLYFTFFFFGLFAQSTDNYTYEFGANINKGFIIKHTPKIGHLATSHPDGFSVYLHKSTFGRHLWESLFNYPDIGFTLHHFNFNNETLGKSWAALTYMEVPFDPPGKRKSGLSFKFGPGIAYHTNPHDQQSNNTNVAIGSNFGFALEAGLTYRLLVLPKIRLNFEASMNHFSNGALSKPNMGINVPALNIGAHYVISEEHPAYQIPKNKEQPLMESTYYLRMVGGVREDGEGGGDKFPFYNMSFYGGEKTSPITRLELGLDAFYDNSLKYRLQDQNGNKKSTLFRVGMIIGNELMVSNLSLITQFGAYLYRNHKAYKPIYQRYGLRIALSQRMATSISLKCHYGRAEYVELGLGLRL